MTFTYLFFTYIFIIISGLLIFTAIGHIFYQKRSPTSMISWTLAIIFLPFFAVPLYFIIGIRKRVSRNKKEYLQLAQPSKHSCYNLNTSKYSILSLLEKNGMPPATQRNNIRLITSDVEAFEEMLKHIKEAKFCIDICTYVFKFDETTKVLIDALTKKAEEGIKVRLLLDIVGSISVYINQRNFKELKKAGAKIAFFTPILKRPFQNYINLRNHRKIYLFDQCKLISGGMNLSNEYMGKVDNKKRWQDLIYILEGPSVYHFYSIFHNDWTYATFYENKEIINQNLDFQGEDIVQVVPSGPDSPTDALYETLLNSIYNAKERIWIVTPYFVPGENIVQALIIAHHKGVDVKIITPKNSNNILADLGRSPYMRELDAIGVDVILYEGEMLHAKAILFDNMAGMVGSVNLDNRSLFLNYEVVTFVYSVKVVLKLESWMKRLMLNSSKGMKKPSKKREAIENIMKVFAPLL